STPQRWPRAHRMLADCHRTPLQIWRTRVDRLVPAVIVITVLALALGLMWLGWRGRARRQATMPRLAAPPADAGAELMAVEAFYVATTERDQPLERIAVGGLGFRARALLTLRERGIELAIPGQEPLFIPLSDVIEVFRARNTIDRVVERDGLVGLRYSIADTRDDAPLEVDSYVRIVDPNRASAFAHEVMTRVSKESAA